MALQAVHQSQLPSYEQSLRGPESLPADQASYRVARQSLPRFSLMEMHSYESRDEYEKHKKRYRDDLEKLQMIPCIGLILSPTNIIFGYVSLGMTERRAIFFMHILIGVALTFCAVFYHLYALPQHEQFCCIPENLKDEDVGHCNDPNSKISQEPLGVGTRQQCSDYSHLQIGMICGMAVSALGLLAILFTEYEYTFDAYKNAHDTLQRFVDTKRDFRQIAHEDKHRLVIRGAAASVGWSAGTDVELIQIMLFIDNISIFFWRGHGQQWLKIILLYLTGLTATGTAMALYYMEEAKSCDGGPIYDDSFEKVLVIIILCCSGFLYFFLYWVMAREAIGGRRDYVEHWLRGSDSVVRSIVTEPTLEELHDVIERLRHGAPENKALV